MAGSVRCFMKLNLGLLSQSVTRHIIINQTRTLFTKQSLGLSAFVNTRDHYKHQFLNLEESFRSKMENYVEDNATGMIFTEDLKVMLHLMDKTPRDSELIVKMLKKFNSQNGEMRFGTYIFGPIVMRACHNLNDCDLALQLFNDQSFGSFFNQLTTYQILLDLLYSNKQYEQMRTIYDDIQAKLTNGLAHPRNSLILISAACYKENTPESFKYGLRLWHDLIQRGYPVIRRVITHFGALALKQGQPNVTLEMLTMARKPRYISIRCLKIMTFVEMDRLVDIVPFFRTSLDSDDPNSKKETYFKDTIELVEAAIVKNKVSPDAEIVKLLNIVKSSDLVQAETLDEHIDTEIEILPQQYAVGPSTNRTYQSHVDNSGPKFIRRPGLRDIV